MLCKFSMLRRKEVINLCDGCRLGCVGDVEVTVPEGCVQKFGDDIILVDKPFRRHPPPPPRRKKGWLF